MKGLEFNVKSLFSVFIILLMITPAAVMFSGSASSSEGESFENPSKIVRASEDVVISDSVLLGVYAYGDSEVRVKDSVVWRVVSFDDSRIVLEDSRVYYVNDHRPELEPILSGVLSGSSSHRERVLSIYEWVRDEIVHDDAPTYGSIQNFNVTKILEYMDGDCGAHSAVVVALAHSAGYPSRLISGKSHMVAEVWYDGEWHLFDSDPSTGAVLFKDVFGNILNAFDLYKNPGLYEKDYFHSWEGDLGRYFSVGVGSFWIDGVQNFVPLNKTNEGDFENWFYDGGWWAYSRPNELDYLVVSPSTEGMLPSFG